MTIDLDNLESLAKAATPGPWEDLSEHPDHLRGTINKGAKHIAGCSWFETPREEQCVTVKEALANAAYIAAVNPAVMLELVAEVRRHRKSMTRLARALQIKNRALAIAQRECKYAQERTTETPTEPGWYFVWYKGKVTICRADYPKGSPYMTYRVVGSPGAWMVTEHADEWAGPIPEPQEPK